MNQHATHDPGVARGIRASFVGAHDPGVRVAHRMGLDYPRAISAMALMDIARTREMYAHRSAAFAEACWRWFLLIQAYPLPERLIGQLRQSVSGMMMKTRGAS